MDVIRLCFRVPLVITRTIKLQQFFPAIGREVDGRIEVLDGTRRRAACIYNKIRNTGYKRQY